MKSNTFILLPILLVVLFGCGGGTLPDEAISAIEKVPVAYGNSQTWMGKIVSAQQTNIRTPNGESWCVVIDPPLLEYPTETSTIIVKREGLLWQVQTYSIGSLPVYGQSEESFLRNGCSNWQETISPSQPDITATPITQKPSQSTNFISTIARNVDWTPVERNFNNLTFVLAPSGCFTMGDTKNIYYDSERPVSQQCFDEPFWISKTEITNQQFSEFINAGGYTERSYWTDVGWRTSPVEHPSLSLSWVDPKFNGPNQPVISVSWFEAMAYASWFGECRLPTEREWEYVARGPDGLNYPWGDEFIPDYIAFDDLRGLFTEEVGSHIEGASWVGALDMAGNAWEWTLSAYYGYPYDPYDGRENTANSPSRVLRGGGSYGAGHIHTTARSDSGYSNAKYYVGFRIVCTIP